MPKVRDIVDLIESFAPKSAVYPDGYDNIGLLVGDAIRSGCHVGGDFNRPAPIG